MEKKNEKKTKLFFRELDIVQQSKEKFLQRENEDKIREFIKGLLEIPVKVAFLSIMKSS